MGLFDTLAGIAKGIQPIASLALTVYQLYQLDNVENTLSEQMHEQSGIAQQLKADAIAKARTGRTRDQLKAEYEQQGPRH